VTGSKYLQNAGTFTLRIFLGGDHWGSQPCASSHLRPPGPKEPRLRARVHERHRRRGSHHSLRGMPLNEVLLFVPLLVELPPSIILLRRPS
jgi:hypothetical protein